MSARVVLPFLCLLITAISSLVQPAALAESGAANPAVTLTGSLSWSRHGHTATLLPNGQVLVAGGGGVKCSYYNGPYNYFCYTSMNDTAELYDPATGSWRLTGSLSRRGYHSATLLPNSHVLVVGGVNYGWDIGQTYWALLDTAELYDPAAGVWRPTQSPTAVRGQSNAVMLPGGKVLVVGKDSTNQTVAELFDPSTETWSLTRAPSFSGPLTLLPAGKVLSASNGSAELYDPTTETWSSAGNFNVIVHLGTMTLLRNGLVLAIGQRSDWGYLTSELYDPATRTWRLTGRLNYGSIGWTPNVTATLLPNGQVLLAGGYDVDAPVSAGSSMELYDPGTETWKPMPNLSVRRDYHTATLLPNDKVLFASGIDENWQFPIFHSSAELFDLGLPRPTSLSISPDPVSQGGCFTMTVGDGAGMILDVQYRLDTGPIQTLTRWPRLDESGRAENICTSLQTPIGTFEFTAIRNSETTQWVPISTSVTVTSP